MFFTAIAAIQWLFVAGFALLFPLLGLTMILTGIAPPGEDPRGPGFAMICAGPCTGVIYGVWAISSTIAAWGLRGARPWAHVAGFIAAALTTLFLPPIGAALGAVAIFLLIQRLAHSTPTIGDESESSQPSVRT